MNHCFFFSITAYFLLPFGCKTGGTCAIQMTSWAQSVRSQGCKMKGSSGPGSQRFWLTLSLQSQLYTHTHTHTLLMKCVVAPVWPLLLFTPFCCYAIMLAAQHCSIDRYVAPFCTGDAPREDSLVVWPKSQRPWDTSFGTLCHIIHTIAV